MMKLMDEVCCSFYSGSLKTQTQVKKKGWEGWNWESYEA
jgi:hypothetical protein